MAEVRPTYVQFHTVEGELVILCIDEVARVVAADFLGHVEVQMKSGTRYVAAKEDTKVLQRVRDWTFSGRVR